MLQLLQVADNDFPRSQSAPRTMARLGIAHSWTLAQRSPALREQQVR